MTRMLRSVGFVLALATAGLSAGAFVWTAGGTAAASSDFTPLPAGWELCVLQGVGAPATVANVADLDDWQAAEGGSTNNTAAFNPYNTLRTTDNTGAPLPNTISANGFPAYATWAAGCAATVATLFQPNMWVITEALRAGNVAPASAFLAVVDQSSWCAPSPSGEPCYVNAMESTPGSLVLDIPASSALDVYGGVNTALQSYQQSIAAVAADQNVVAVRNLALAASESQVESARNEYGVASRALQGFAISEYVNSGLYSGAPLVSSGGTQPLTPSTPRSKDGVIAQQYLRVAANDLIDQNNSAAGNVRGSERQRGDAAKALAQAALALTSDEAAENSNLTQLIADVATLEHAGACATVAITPPPSAATAAPGGASAATTTTSTTVGPTTTTTTGVRATTTTTVPPTTTTSTVPTGIPLNTPGPTTSTTTTTTTAPPPTTTTAVPPTTTTTTVPSAALPATSTAPVPVAAGVSALQGCIATFAPTTNT